MDYVFCWGSKSGTYVHFLNLNVLVHRGSPGPERPEARTASSRPDVLRRELGLRGMARVYGRHAEDRLAVRRADRYDLLLSHYLQERGGFGTVCRGVRSRGTAQQVVRMAALRGAGAGRAVCT